MISDAKEYYESSENLMWDPKMINNDFPWLVLLLKKIRQK